MAGWPSPQAVIDTLRGPAESTLGGGGAPEPLFFRANTDDRIAFRHTAPDPRTARQNDFQLFTPTDAIGQHIHLVKFDVTSSDGAGNGWNYEDGTFSPGEVQERIHALNAADRLLRLGGAESMLALRARQFFGLSGRDAGRKGVDDWLVVRAATRRWYADQIHSEDGNGIDDLRGIRTAAQRWYIGQTFDSQDAGRALRTVFTHDHYEPSSHQQVGLYAGLIVEQRGSPWRRPDWPPGESANADYLNQPGATAGIQWNGAWGPAHSGRSFGAAGDKAQLVTAGEPEDTRPPSLPNNPSSSPTVAATESKAGVPCAGVIDRHNELPLNVVGRVGVKWASATFPVARFETTCSREQL